MKFKFKEQQYQTDAVEAVVDCFVGQLKNTGIQYRIDPGRVQKETTAPLSDDGHGFKNADIILSPATLLANIHRVQQRSNLDQSTVLASDKISQINLDIEMETGTGKTYCYIKTMFELNHRYGWSKFIVVVPSIAIREGVYKSLDMTSDHFLQDYGKRIRAFIYNSKELHNLESFSSDAGISVIVINVQAFNATGKDARRIYEELDDFQSRKPIDVIKSNRPILILDEPQKMEGIKTLESLKSFNPLMILRYSATHKTTYNKIHRLDALDAYNQKLVKKIAVRGISVKGLSGTNAYLYLESIEISSDRPPIARVELEIKQNNGIKRVTRKLEKNDNLFDISDGLDQYKGFVISDINANTDTLYFTNGVELEAGDAMGDVDEIALRRIQIREAIKAHFEKEKALYYQGIKVLSLFFIDEVAKYRRYDESGENPGEYAQIFEEEYTQHLNEILTLEDTAYNRYLKEIPTSRTHDGYFSIDKKSKRLVDPVTGKKSETDDVDAYDLILKKKEQLLSFEEPVRFIFSHSALREGWDNPNVFVICTLKHSDNNISRRQEVGRGMRISVNQNGDRMDNLATVHQINVLTVVASESYRGFVAELQQDIRDSLSARPRIANEEYFTGKIFKTAHGDVSVTPQMAKQIYKYLLKHDYTDDNDKITQTYHDAKTEASLAQLPIELAPYSEQVFQLIDSIFSESQLPVIGNDRAPKKNPLSANFEKKEFRELWNRINRKAAYTVHFDTSELIERCVAAVDKELRVSPLQYTIIEGQQTDSATYDNLKQGNLFKINSTTTESHQYSANSTVKYDLIGKLAEATTLTRNTISKILQGINVAVFSQYKTNPEDFIAKSTRLINEQKATAIIEKLTYDSVGETFNIDIFTQEKPADVFSNAFKANRHIFDYVFTDSKIERTFVESLDTSTEIVVYAKLPRGFFIPTPVGDYNPDWAIAFKDGSVKHIYFIAETKGSMSSMELREIEKCKIECARKFFTKITSDQVTYDVVDSYGKLMELVTA